MVLEVEENSLVAGVKPSTKEREPTILHNRGSLIMTTKEEKLLQEVEKVKVEVEELIIIVINAISWDIDRLSVHTMKKRDTKEYI